MKRKVTASILLISLLLLPACNRNNSEPDESGETDTVSAETSSVETAEVTQTTVVQTYSTAMETEFSMEFPDTGSQGMVSDEVRNAAYWNYLSVLDTCASDISAYTWMTVGNTLAQEHGFIAPADNIPCSFVDLTGDGLEELVIMTAVNDMMASIEVYSYDPAEGFSRIILGLDGVDVQAGGGGTYALALMDNGSLFVSLSSGDDEWYDDYSVFDYNSETGMMELVGILSRHEYPNEDGSESFNEYWVNGEFISEDDYNSCRNMLTGHIREFLQYNLIADDQLMSTFSGRPCTALSYDGMRAYIENSINYDI